MSDYYGLFRPLFKYENKNNKKTLRGGAFWSSFLDSLNKIRWNTRILVNLRKKKKLKNVA
jgi:hypothetical protein